LSWAPPRIFEALFLPLPYAFWLDSSRHEAGQARFSILGAGDGPLSYRIEGSVAGGTILHAVGKPEQLDNDVFTVLDECLASATVQTDQHLPFEFRGGFVGYLGYELMAVTEQVHGHASPTPDAELLFVDRFLAIDHATGDLYTAALHTGDPSHGEAWFVEVEDLLRTLSVSDRMCDAVPPLRKARDVEPFLLHDKATYLRQIASAKQKILEGESHEVCLTNRVRVSLRPHTTAELFNTYLAMREISPVPYRYASHQHPAMMVENLKLTRWRMFSKGFGNELGC
jgi:para-aminobenzoate synthetase